MLRVISVTPYLATGGCMPGQNEDFLGSQEDRRGRRLQWLHLWRMIILLSPVLARRPLPRRHELENAAK
jgi:hypothetical protein